MGPAGTDSGETVRGLTQRSKAKSLASTGALGPIRGPLAEL
jgi:hypothetical protein